MQLKEDLRILLPVGIPRKYKGPKWGHRPKRREIESPDVKSSLAYHQRLFRVFPRKLGDDL